jgi:hypothetical protein
MDPTSHIAYLQVDNNHKYLTKLDSLKNNLWLNYYELAWVARAIARLDETNHMLQMEILT